VFHSFNYAMATDPNNRVRRKNNRKEQATTDWTDDRARSALSADSKALIYSIPKALCRGGHVSTIFSST
jgi:hypothetical protein